MNGNKCPREASIPRTQAYLRLSEIPEMRPTVVRTIETRETWLQPSIVVTILIASAPPHTPRLRARAVHPEPSTSSLTPRTLYLSCQFRRASFRSLAKFSCCLPISTTRLVSVRRVCIQRVSEPDTPNLVPRDLYPEPYTRCINGEPGVRTRPLGP